MSGVNLDGYVDVATRRRMAVEVWPDLRIVEGAPEVITVGDSMFVQVTVTVHRSPDDPMPTSATCWERVPGRTPYTRDSEMMNCATSALGRALGYMGVGVINSLATRDEVALRTDVDAPTGPEPSPVKASSPPNQRAATQPQLGQINALLSDLGIQDRAARLEMVKAIIGRSIESAKEMTTPEASKVIGTLKAEVTTKGADNESR